ncbi:MAG TPA: hypothetical protein VMF65_14655 [Acidimicrobiales bacterium]|nr:hypothetical protein [Acidimicrobiales bacterium]
MLMFRKRAWLRNAPTGFEQVVDIDLATSPPDGIDQTILRWGKLGYDLQDRSEYTTPGLGTSEHVVLTFVKR